MAEESDAKKRARRKASAAVFDAARARLEAALPELTNPWHVAPPNFEIRSFAPDMQVLAQLVSLPVLQDAGSNTGRLGKMIDAWVSYELRRAGFDSDAVWPRPTDPRVWPTETAQLLERALVSRKEPIEAEIDRQGVATASVLGKHYFKQIDVLMASWDRGAELMVSTKAQMSSFGNNLNNRFEEFVGDAHNLRGRFPLAALGLVYVVRSTIRDEPANYAKLIDMLQGLRAPDLYDATCMVVVEYDSIETVDSLDLTGGWPREQATEPQEHEDFDALVDQCDTTASVSPHTEHALQVGPALKHLVDCVLARSPVTEHEHARELRANPSQDDPPPQPS